MIDKHLTPEQIAQAADKQIARCYQELPEAVKQHLKDCDHCASEVLDVIEIVDSEATKVKTTTLRKMSVVVSIAAAILLFITFILFPLKQESQRINHDEQLTIAKNNTPNIDTTDKDLNHKEEIERKEKKIQTQKKRTQSKPYKVQAKQAQNKKVLYASYEPNPELEALVDRTRGHMRGLTISSFPIEIKYPEQRNLKVPVPKNYSLIVEIYTNKGDLVSEKTLTDSVFTIPELKGGLYYWKLINEDFDLLFVGRIKSETPKK